MSRNKTLKFHPKVVDNIIERCNNAHRWCAHPDQKSGPWYSTRGVYAKALTSRATPRAIEGESRDVFLLTMDCYSGIRAQIRIFGLL